MSKIIQIAVNETHIFCLHHDGTITKHPIKYETTETAEPIKPSLTGWDGIKTNEDTP